MMMTPSKLVSIAALAVFLTFSLLDLRASASESVELPNHAKLELGTTCPVCGMKVGGNLEAAATYGYQAGKLSGFAGVAAAVFKDGTVASFDGARCLFVYNTIPKRVGIDVANIAHMFVTDFASKNLIDVNEAFLVLGSNIHGFMGYDLIPFASRDAADKFLAEYGGRRVVQAPSLAPKDVDRTQE
jgi:copper chaperone NosL